MSVAVQVVMEGMPEPRDLRVSVCDGWTLVTVGCRVVAGYGLLQPRVSLSLVAATPCLKRPALGAGSARSGIQATATEGTCHEPIPGTAMSSTRTIPR